MVRMMITPMTMNIRGLRESSLFGFGSGALLVDMMLVGCGLERDDECACAVL